MEVKEKVSVFSTMENDINSICRTAEEKERVKKLLLQAEKESKEKKIIRVRDIDPLLKFITLWKIRFYYGLHWSKPLYPFRIVRNILLGKIYNLFKIKKYVLRGIEFATTFKCNFSCNHCLCARIDESKNRIELTPKDYQKIVKEAMQLGATTFGMEGGEPFVKKDWIKILESWRPKYNHIIISTNGYLFDEEKARICRQLGVDTINFSLDSGIEELHDAFRCKRGSFKQVINSIKLCKKYGIKVIINSCVHKGNLYTEGLIKLLELCEKEKILLNTLFAKGVGAFKEKDVMLDSEDLKAYEEIIKPYNYVQRHLAYNYGKQFGCPGTKEMINMTPYGDVMNCANMHIYFGNVLEEPLKVIRERAIQDTPFGRYAPCFLADDKDFMNIYYKKLDEKSDGRSVSMSIDEFKGAVWSYQKDHNKIVYPELKQ